MEETMRVEKPMKLALCGCGRLHLTCGPVTLHFTRDEFVVFAESVRRLAAVAAHPSGQAAVTGAPEPYTGVCH